MDAWCLKRSSPARLAGAVSNDPFTSNPNFECGYFVFRGSRRSFVVCKGCGESGRFHGEKQSLVFLPLREPSANVVPFSRTADVNCKLTVRYLFVTLWPGVAVDA